MTTACEYDIQEEQAHENPPVSVDETLAAKNRRLAKKLNALGIVHGLYGGLDGLSLSYSMVKYGFDLLYTDTSLSSSDLMHDWMMTPEGFAAAFVESAFIVSFSLFGLRGSPKFMSQPSKGNKGGGTMIAARCC